MSEHKNPPFGWKYKYERLVPDQEEQSAIWSLKCFHSMIRDVSQTRLMAWTVGIPNRGRRWTKKRVEQLLAYVPDPDGVFHHPG